MLKLRLKRLGRKKQVFYKIVIMENLSKRNAKSLDELGYYDPQKKLLKLNQSKLRAAFKLGIYPTNTLRHLIYKFKRIQKINKIITQTEEKKKQEAKLILNKKIKRTKQHYQKNYKKAKKTIARLLTDFRKKFEIKISPVSFPKEKLTPQKLLLFLKTNSRKALRRNQKKKKKSEIITLISKKTT